MQLGRLERLWLAFHISYPLTRVPKKICPRRFCSDLATILGPMTAPPKPWEVDANARRRQVRAHLIQEALWAPALDACMEACMEQQDWDDGLPNR